MQIRNMIPAPADLWAFFAGKRGLVEAYPVVALAVERCPSGRDDMDDQDDVIHIVERPGYGAYPADGDDDLLGFDFERVVPQWVHDELKKRDRAKHG